MHNINEGQFNPMLAVRIIFLVVMDAAIITLSKFAAIFIRFEFSFAAIPERFYFGFQEEILPSVIITLCVFGLFRLYRSLWDYAGVDECLRIFAAALLSAVLNIFFNKAMDIFMFRSYYVMSFMIGTKCHMMY